MGITYFNRRNKLHPYHYLASVLYPPSNAMRIMSNEEEMYTRNLLKTEYQKYNAQIVKEPNTATKSDKFAILANAINVNTTDEITRYLQNNIQPDDDFDLLNWWKINRSTFPILYEIAMKVFAIPATSARSEREFSYAGTIVTEKRSRLEPTKVESLLLLKRNFYLLQN